jgi:hypothetical protein
VLQQSAFVLPDSVVRPLAVIARLVSVLQPELAAGISGVI